MRDLAQLFQWQALFCQAPSQDQVFSGASQPSDESEPCAFEDIAPSIEQLICFDSVAKAQSIYGFKKPPLERLALTVGHERRGIRKELLKRANKVLKVPMASKRVNSLNVAAAASVALYYLSRGSAPIFTRSEPEKHRPDLLIVAGKDHTELGSSLRSAAAFGWRQVYLQDSHEAWFHTDRARQLESRAAARRSKNKIRIVPTRAEDRFHYDEVVVVSRHFGAERLNKAPLAKGARQLIVLADETEQPWEGEAERLGTRVRSVKLEFPGEKGYHFRFAATIALAEIARQVGIGKKGRRKTCPGYRRELAAPERPDGMTVSLEELIEWDEAAHEVSS